MSALRSAKNAPVEFKDKTCLVIDDIIGVRSSMRITITTFGGVKVDMAANAADAINKIEHRKYDIILCDYSLGEAKRRGYRRQVCWVDAGNKRMLSAAIQLYGFRIIGEIRTTNVLKRPFSTWTVGRRGGRGGTAAL